MNHVVLHQHCNNILAELIQVISYETFSDLCVFGFVCLCSSHKTTSGKRIFKNFKVNFECVTVLNIYWLFIILLYYFVVFFCPFLEETTTNLCMKFLTIVL